MYSLFFLAANSFLLALLLTPIFRDLFRRWGFVDLPDGKRKLHPEAVPRVGGLPIALSCLVSFGLLLVSPLGAGQMLQSALPLAWRLMPAVGVLFLTGLLDDLVGLRPWQKLAGQTMAAAAACLGGVRIHGVEGLPLHAWGVPLTLLWLVG